MFDACITKNHDAIKNLQEETVQSPLENTLSLKPCSSQWIYWTVCPFSETLHRQNYILKGSSCIGRRKFIEHGERRQAVFSLQRLRFLNAGSSKNGLMDFTVTDVLHRHSAFLYFLVQRCIVFQMKKNWSADEAKASTVRKFAHPERFQIHAGLPCKRQMFSKQISLLLQRLTLSSELQCSLAAFSQQRARRKRVPERPFSFGMTQDVQHVDSFCCLDVIEVFIERDINSKSWIWWKSVVLLVSISDKIWLGQISNCWWNQLDKFLISVRKLCLISVIYEARKTHLKPANCKQAFPNK